MSPQPAPGIVTTPASSTANKDDGPRARELYKYFLPFNNTSPTSRSAAAAAEYPDKVLNSHAQLTALRLDTERAVISLIDRDTQYFVAESTKTQDLEDAEGGTAVADHIWAGCQSVPKAGRLCEMTIKQSASSGKPACYEVLDLSQDERFKNLPFVRGPPYFRYYVGVPLRTKKGIPIGSLFAMDTKPREPLSAASLRFLTTMASNVMSHLELKREKEDRKRSVNMNMCLAAFVDPENHLRKRKRNPSIQLEHTRSSSSLGEYKTSRSARSEGAKTRSPVGNGKAQKIPRSPAKGGPQMIRRFDRERSHAEDSDESGEDSEVGSRPRVAEGDRLETLERASELLLESLSLQNGGGVVFMSTAAELRPDGIGKPSVSSKKLTLSTLQDLQDDNPSPRDEVLAEFIQTSPEADVNTANASLDPNERAEILAYSEASSMDAPNVNSPSFIPLSPVDLAKLIRRHMRGKLYSFGDDGLTQGSSGEETLPNFNLGPSDRARKPASKSEAAILARHFPGARQIIFIPTWDESLNRWTACFIYNSSDYRTLSHSPDYLHSISFCNCVMTEIARLATIVADQQKSDFIGSISHELRSPLHGILASCELLDATETTSYQKSLVSTADSCARTLLDTINMVLDYSKINTFEKNIRKAKKTRSKDTSTNPASLMAQPTFNIYETVDLAAITEEVVEGVSIGHVFKDIANLEATIQRLPTSPSASGKTSLPPISRSPVEVTLDIEARDWNFITQPGALRRITMNLLGNALKYTKQGFVKVKLEAKDLKNSSNCKSECQEPQATSIVTLTVSDSGQGISPEYLNTKLFVPFAQESNLNPGVGLGLSLVRSIVEMLNGEVNITSAVGVGTEVFVTLPMVKAASGSGTTANSTQSSAPVSASSSGVASDSCIKTTLDEVRELSKGKTVAVYIPRDYRIIDELTRISVNSVRDTVTHYMKEWYGFAHVVDWSPGVKADLVGCDEFDLPALLQSCPDILSKAPDAPALLVSRSNTQKRSMTDNLLKDVYTEYLPQPVGPYKLSRALLNVLGHRAQRMVGGKKEGLETVSEQSVEETLSAAASIHHITLPREDNGAEIRVLQQGEIIGKEDSIAAQVAMGTIPGPQTNPVKQQQQTTGNHDGGTATSRARVLAEPRPLIPRTNALSLPHTCTTINAQRTIATATTAAARRRQQSKPTTPTHVSPQARPATNRLHSAKRRRRRLPLHTTPNADQPTRAPRNHLHGHQHARPQRLRRDAPDPRNRSPLERRGSRRSRGGGRSRSRRSRHDRHDRHGSRRRRRRRAIRIVVNGNDVGFDACFYAACHHHAEETTATQTARPAVARRGADGTCQRARPERSVRGRRRFVSYQARQFPRGGPLAG
ncbi:uncharacterized protein IWZ02DRAFT_214021 [Phyllosticta citriasiana]|uniref:uncharacterized protein n=1 Tax=Phyllosticta citriasiana TaxID=595635 RepID=UPI0030FD6BD9